MWHLKIIIPIWAAISASRVQEGRSGTIVLTNYGNDHNQEWNVESECESVHITSTHFSTEGGYDHLTIDEESYSGTVEISQIVGSAFTVVFSSDQSVTNTGFSLLWSCYDDVDQLPAGLQCSGNAFSGNKIIAGTDSAEHRWPFIFSLQRNNYHNCGGSILNEEWVMTAAHCCDGLDINSGWEVVVGAHDHTTPSANEQRLNIKRVIMHPNFADEGFIANDMCLLKVDAMVLGSDVQVVCLPEQNEMPLSNEGCFVGGWGATCNPLDHNCYPTKLQSVNNNILSDEQCSNSLVGGSFIGHAEICAIKIENGSPVQGNACNGDSGGPLVCVVDGEARQYGVVSWGMQGCMLEGSPSVFAEVSSYISWMKTIIRDTQNPIGGRSGTIVLTNYENNHNQEWVVNSECESVHITSTHFSTEGGYDHLTIDEESYSGTVEISQIVGSSFTVSFSSDQSVTNTGFTLLWSCYEPNIEPTYEPVTEPTYDHIPVGTKCTSGNPFSNARVVQGIEVVPHSWPWIVSLQLGDFHFCGGTIVNAEWIVTAAHCCVNQNPRRVTVVTGEHDFSSSSGVRAQSIEIHIHPDYSGGNDMANDICLIKTQSMNIDGIVAEAVCLPEQGSHIIADDADTAPNTNCYVAGWGTTENDSSPDELQSARVNVFSAEYCADNTNLPFDPSAEFCAGYVSGGRDTCQGDSGGPLICVVNDRPTLYGITSWGYGCGEVGRPGVYAKVSPQINWFNQVINSMTTTSVPPIMTTSEAPTTATPMTGTSGVIELNNYENDHDQVWVVHSECESVHITSTQFATEGCCDHLTIDDELYSGTGEISQIVGSSFTVSFSSDYSVTNTGFTLLWSCYDDVSITTTESTATTTIITSTTTSTLDGKAILTITVDLGTAINYHSNLLIPGTAEYNAAVLTIMSVFDEALAQLATENGLTVDNTQVAFTDGSATENNRKRRSAPDYETADATLSFDMLSIPTNTNRIFKQRLHTRILKLIKESNDLSQI